MPDDLELTLDELHLDAAAVPERDLDALEDDPINEIKPEADSPEDLEVTAQLKRDLEKDELETDVNKENDTTDVSPDKEDPKKDSDKEIEKEEDIQMSGIELYLSQFDVEGGMIAFDDGSSVHFNELEPDKQKEVLSQLHATTATSVEEKYGLDEQEVGLLNYLRTNKLSVDDMVEGMVAERINTLMALQNIESRDYDKLEDDAIYVQFLKKSNPEATADQLEDDLKKAKEQSNFSKVTNSIRGQFKKEQETFVRGKLAEEKKEQVQVIEDQRQEVVNSALGINDIAGIKLDDNLKNSILDRVLEVNDHGDSKFMEEVFGDPEKLINAAFWYYYGSSIMQQRDNYWKQQKSGAYKRGREEALGKDSTKISFTSAQKKAKQGEINSPLDDDDWLSLHT